MSEVAKALDQFRFTYECMMNAAGRVRAAIEAEAGIAGRGNKSVRRIATFVAKHYGFTLARLMDRDRTQDIANARLVAMWMCRKHTTCSLQTIGEAFLRDHGAVMSAIRSVDARLETEPRYKAELKEIERALYPVTNVRPKDIAKEMPRCPQLAPQSTPTPPSTRPAVSGGVFQLSLAQPAPR